MRSLQEAQRRWQATKDVCANTASLRRAIRQGGSESPCVCGCRSVCWKALLMSRDSSAKGWRQALDEGRRGYIRLRSQFLKYIEHPEELTELNVDPLADDPESPWTTLREDELIRAEILQDVERLPDEASYHQDSTRAAILDILFIYCKANPGHGGYRQGMHELLAPIVYVVEQDAIDAASAQDSSLPPPLDPSMLQVVNSAYVEHDAYLLFSRLMEHAQAFYNVSDEGNGPSCAKPNSTPQDTRSAIVDRSKLIHNVCLQKLDWELASHLSNVDILPQIFLIRWIRLLFSREFPFDQVLILWDSIFAVDPSLDLVDFICCAMLIRIRSQLLQADYSACLQLLLKYPRPEAPYLAHMFVNDAIHLRDDMSAAGGAALMAKYEDRQPDTLTPSPLPGSVPSSPQRSGSLGHRGFGTRSPLPSPSRLMQNSGGVESLWQGAAKSAKGVLERGERLGLNQAVREAMTEIRRNMHSFQEARHSPRASRDFASQESAVQAFAALQRRNKQLADLLDETVTNLKAISVLKLQDKTKSLELIEIAAAKIQFVQVYLNESSLQVPTFDTATASSAQYTATQIQAEDETVSRKQSSEDGCGPVAEKIGSVAMSDDDDEPRPTVAEERIPCVATVARSAHGKVAVEELSNGEGVVQASIPLRPAAPMPTRSTLAQSSFSWMLEPEDTIACRKQGPERKFLPVLHKKRTSRNVSSERNAFLFGDVAVDADSQAALRSDDIFGMEPMHSARNERPDL
ncbi:hypothetical protein CDD81_5150 [Ophiocordyceps australis]|uniref:Rab-GAP TBC domain-containing protein n=1 Tax=Ophiocordyceps australis TaxID=1399860 RepID=A0A2C5YAM7_9HYPO|nr:hypothetical protein CDD81_5150 [Ophiocordyceps australis]